MTTYTSPSGYTYDNATEIASEVGGLLDYWSDDDIANDTGSVKIECRVEPLTGSVTGTFPPVVVTSTDVVVVGFFVAMGSVG